MKLNGKIYNVKTNSEGQATLSLKNLNNGTYKTSVYVMNSGTLTSNLNGTYNLSYAKCTCQ